MSAADTTHEPVPKDRIIRRLARWLPFLVVTAFGLYVLWPVPTGVMPLSADHTVHLTRAYLYGQQLAGGHLVGWSPTWFFGFPLGELYPVLGDLGVLALRLLSFGLLDWPQAYALLFTLVFLTQGWVMLRCGRALGWGPLPGTISGLLVLADVGAYREGGWTYTVLYGVWPQALATALAWLAFAELTFATRPNTRHTTRHLLLAALAAGAALLAHPMALLMFAVGAPIYLFTIGLRPRITRAQLADTALALTLALGLGLALAAWWLVPMTAHRGWMASYGWLHASLADMARMASRGQWTQAMPAAVGHTATIGLAFAALFGRPALRFFALWTLAHWLLASTDLFWDLRLDWLSGGFQHIQYQRFLIAAKPGFFLLAGAAVGGLAHLSLRTYSSLKPALKTLRILAAVPLAAALALMFYQARDTRVLAQRHHLGAIQTERIPGQPAFAGDYADFLRWAHDTWKARTHDYRIAFRADRNLHWFMDAPVTTDTPSYKIGFTPGDNFVHKPESGDPLLLRRLGVRFVVSTASNPPAGAALTQRFGRINVFELEQPGQLAHLEGPGTLTIEHATLGEDLQVRLADVAPDTRLVLHLAGYPRWELQFQPDRGPPELVEWFEAPVLGDSPIATLAQRRAGELRGGKALGDDGHEPTLIAAPARDGVYTLRYLRWRRPDLIGLGLTLLAIAGLLALARRGVPPLLRRLAHRITVPVLLLGLALALALAALRYHQGAEREHDLASAHLRRGDALAVHMLAGPLKTDMIVFPAVLAQPGSSGSSEVTFPHVQLGPTLDGWYALDDDDAKQRRRGAHRLKISARPTGAATWTLLADIPVPHRPDRRHLNAIAVPPTLQSIALDLQIAIETTGDAPPRLGFDLTLPTAPRP